MNRRLSLDVFQGKRILLLDGITSQSIEYAKAFNALGCDTTVLCNDIFDAAYASRQPKHKIIGVSSSSDLAGTEQWILKLVESDQYDVVLCFTEYSARILTEHKGELSKHARIAINDRSVFDKAQDKNEVMRICMGNGIPCPGTFFGVETASDIENEIRFPVILKPSHGFGSHGIHIAQNRRELSDIVNRYSLRLTETVIQEYIPKGSLNVSENMFIDRNGEIKISFTYASYRFYPLDGGSGVLNVTIDRKDVHETAAKVARLFHLRGPIGIDMIVDSRDDTPKVLEINLRPIACAKVGFLAGVNQAQQILEDFFSDSVTPMMDYKSDVRVRRSQIDIMWFLKSPDRFRTKPSWFDWKNTTDQLFSWSDPLPWFSFWVYGIRKTLRER